MLIFFILSNLNIIFLLIWVIFWVLVVFKYFKPHWINNISYFNLFLVSVGIHIFFGVLVTWGQYYVWANGSELTKLLLTLPVSPETPFPRLFLFIRPFFENSLGYFLYYVFGRVWLNIFLSFLISGALYLVFRVWNYYRVGFLKEGPLLLLILMLISGFPGVIVSVALGFTLSVLFFGVFYLRGIKTLTVEPIFIFSTILSLLFTNIILLNVL